MSKKGSKVFEYVLITMISLLVAASFVFFSLDNLKKKSNNAKSEKVVFTEADLNKLLEDYKNKYNTINIYNLDGYTSLLGVKDDGTYNSFVIDNNTGKEVNPISLIKKDKMSEFEEKEDYLLRLKYAAFIVKGIKDTNGKKIYEFKTNELVIYYQDYKYEPLYDKEVILHINYNEISNCLVFKPQLDEQYENENGYNYDPTKTTVAISFDDGPNNNNTLELLKVLDENKMTATFFMLGGKMNNQSEIVKKVHNSLNEIGSHTYSHINMKRVSLKDIKNELDNTNATYKKIIGEDLKLVRPPYGSFTRDIISNFNNYFILWNVDTNDWRYKDVDYLVDYILDNIQDGNIILMHDSYETSIEAVKRVLPMLYAKDIQVVSVSTLAKLKGKTMSYGQPYYSFK